MACHRIGSAGCDLLHVQRSSIRCECDLLAEGAERALGALRPAVVVQAASVQTSSVIAAAGEFLEPARRRWRFERYGGLPGRARATRVAAAMHTRSAWMPRSSIARFPDVVNPMIGALGHRVARRHRKRRDPVERLRRGKSRARARPAEGARPLPDHRGLASPAEARSGATPRVFIDAGGGRRRVRCVPRRPVDAGACDRNFGRQRRSPDPCARSGQDLAGPRSGPEWAARADIP